MPGRKGNRVGETITASNGQKMTVIEDFGCNNLTVQFEDGTVRENIRYSNFKQGRVKNTSMQDTQDTADTVIVSSPVTSDFDKLAKNIIDMMAAGEKPDIISEKAGIRRSTLYRYLTMANLNSRDIRKGILPTQKQTEGFISILKEGKVIQKQDDNDTNVSEQAPDLTENGEEIEEKENKSVIEDGTEAIADTNAASETPEAIPSETGSEEDQQIPDTSVSSEKEAVKTAEPTLVPKRNRIGELVYKPAKEIINLLLEKEGCTLKHLAEKLDMQELTLLQYTHGAIGKNTSYPTLKRKIEVVFDIPEDFFIQYVHPDENPTPVDLSMLRKAKDNHKETYKPGNNTRTFRMLIDSLSEIYGLSHEELQYEIGIEKKMFDTMYQTFGDKRMAMNSSIVQRIKHHFPELGDDFFITTPEEDTQIIQTREKLQAEKTTTKQAEPVPAKIGDGKPWAPRPRPKKAKPFYKKASEVVAILLEKEKCTLKQLAEKLGMNARSLSNYAGGAIGKNRNYAPLRERIDATFNLPEEFYLADPAEVEKNTSVKKPDDKNEKTRTKTEHKQTKEALQVIDKTDLAPTSSVKSTKVTELPMTEICQLLGISSSMLSQYYQKSGKDITEILNDIRSIGMKNPEPNGQVQRPISSTASGTDKLYPFFVIGDINVEIRQTDHSFQIDEDVLNRIRTLENSKRQYTHSAILNQLLRDGLSKYEY